MAWILLAAFWTLRIFGAALDPRWQTVCAGVRTLLVAALGWVLLYAAKDARLLIGTNWGRTPRFTSATRGRYRPRPSAGSS